MPSFEPIIVMFALEVLDGPCTAIPFLHKICLLFTVFPTFEIDDIISICVSELEVHSANLVIERPIDIFIKWQFQDHIISN